MRDRYDHVVQELWRAKARRPRRAKKIVQNLTIAKETLLDDDDDDGILWCT